MTKPNKVITDIVSLFLSGLGVGWLVGLSVSPLTQVIVTAIIAVIASTLTGMAGLNTRTEGGSQLDEKGALSKISKIHVTPLPMASFICGLVTGSTLGIIVRTNQILGMTPNKIIQQWAGAGLPEEIIRPRLFSAEYPPYQEKPTDGEAHDKKHAPLAVNSQAPYLFAGYTADECTEFRSAPTPTDLRRLMQGSSDPRIRSFAANCKDDKNLSVAMEYLICKK